MTVDKKLFRFSLHCCLAACALVILTSPITATAARVLTDLGGWSTPINLSHSGSADQPLLVLDTSGRYHAVWLDAYDGYMVSESSDGTSWSKPVPVGFPFGVKDSAPVFLADTQGVIHAFWKDSTNALLYSRVAAGSFRSGLQWQVPTPLADPVADFDAAVDQFGTVHLAYVLAESTLGVAATLPAGIYYRDTSELGSKWTVARTLYQSPYLRAVGPGQAHIRLTLSNDGARIYVVFDNRLLKRIVFARSSDRGKSWIGAVALKKPDANLGAATPYNGLLISTGQGLLFFWQIAVQGAGCSFDSQLSSDEGITWSAPVEVISNLSVCPQDYHVYLTKDQAAIVTTNLGSQVVLSAWNGSQWSNTQSVLSSFTDPDTLDPVALSCQTVAVTSATQLVTVGCDKIRGDIWLSARPVEALATWFPPLTKWNAPSLLTAVPADISSVSLVADDADHLSAFWAQNYQTDNVITGTIVTAKWDGEQWATPVVLMASPQSDIGQLAIETDGHRLLMVWSEGSTGAINFSWANLGRTDIPAEWATPIGLVPNGTAATDPHLMIGDKGTIVLSYAVAVNENRGVYFVQSMDAGISWSTPVNVFDAVAAGWRRIAAPLLVDSGGSWNAIWTRYPLPGSHEPLGLFAGQSLDDGKTWTTLPEVVEGRINWSTLLGAPGSALHRLWQMSDGSDRIIWHQFSNDAGKSWTQTSSITGLGAYTGLPSSTLDTAGQLHLFQTKLNAGHSPEVEYWLWSDGGWTSQDSMAIDDNSEPVAYLASAITDSRQLVLVYPGSTKDTSSGNSLNALYYSSRMIDLPAGTATPQVPSTPIATPGVKSTALPAAAAATATVTPANNPTDGAGARPATTNNPWLGVLLGSGLVALLIGALFTYHRLPFGRRQ